VEDLSKIIDNVVRIRLTAPRSGPRGDTEIKAPDPDPPPPTTEQRGVQLHPGGIASLSLVSAASGHGTSCSQR